MNCWNPKSTLTLNSMIDMVISIQATWRHVEGSTTRKTRLMTERKHKDKDGIICPGCKNEFGRINIVHIKKCDELSKLRVFSKEDFKVKYGDTSAKYLKEMALSTINNHNNKSTYEQKSSWGKMGFLKSQELYPDFCSNGGKKDAESLWKKEGQREKHRKRLINLNAKGFMASTPNKLESYFSEMINDNNLYFAGHRFWRTIKTSNGFKGITPDFKLKCHNIVVEIFGNYWHKKHEEEQRVKEWSSVGLKCIVFWEDQIRNDIESVKKDYYKFISRNSHECPTPDIDSQGDDIV